MLSALSTVIAAAIGAVFGGVVAPYFSHYFSNRLRNADRHEAAKLVSDALRGEVRSLRTQSKAIHNRLHYYFEIQQRSPATSAKARETLRKDLLMFAKTKMPVFETKLDEIGYLWTKVSKNVVEYYSDLRFATNFAGSLAQIYDVDEFDERAVALQLETNSLIEEATGINFTLMQLSLDPKYPKGLERNGISS